MNKSFVHQSKAQVLWLKFVYTIFGTEVLGCCRKIFKKGCLTKIFKILHLRTPFKEISTPRMKITQSRTRVNYVQGCYNSLMGVKCHE